MPKSDFAGFNPKCSIVKSINKKRTYILPIIIVTLLLISGNLVSFLFITDHSIAATPEISKTDVMSTTNWDLQNLNGLTLDNLTYENTNLKLSKKNSNKIYSSTTDFGPGIFNGTMVTSDNNISLGFLPNFNSPGGNGWNFQNSSSNRVTSVYDNIVNEAVFGHLSFSQPIYKEINFQSANGTGTGSLVGDVIADDGIGYIIEKNENMTLFNPDIIGLTDYIVSITVHTKFVTSNVYSGNFSLHIWDPLQLQYSPLNITPSEFDASGVNIYRSDVLNATFLSKYNNLQKLLDFKLYWKNNCEQAAKSVVWDRIWLNITYLKNISVNPLGNTAFLNYTLTKTFNSPAKPNEINFVYDYNVISAQNTINSNLKFFIDGFEINSEVIPSAGSIIKRTIDVSSYLSASGKYNLSIQLMMNYSTSLPVNCSLRIFNIQLIPRSGSYISSVYDAGQNTFWDTISWIEKKNTGSFAIEFETRSGNSTNTLDSTWSSWSSILTKPTGSVIESPSSRYIQYRITFIAFIPNDVPFVNSVNLAHNNFESRGFLTTSNINPYGLTKWISFTANYQTNGGNLNKYYSTDGGTNWISIPANGSLTDASGAINSIKIRIEFETLDYLSTPVLFNFSIVYNTLNHVPSIPDMIFPPEKSHLNILKPTFNWSESFDFDSGDTVSYNLYYSNDPGFSSNVIEVKGITDKEYTPTVPLDDNTIYYWKIVSIDNHGAENTTSTSRSSVFLTNTQNDPPLIPKLVSPINNTLFSSNDLVFDWADSTDPDFGDAVASYTIEISKDPTFANKDITLNGITKSSLVFDQLLENNIFYWRVEAVDSHGLGSGFQDMPNKFIIDIQYPEILPPIPDLITGEDFPYTIDLYDYIDSKFQSLNLSWNLVGVNTELFNWNVKDNRHLDISPVSNAFGLDTFTIELYSDGILRDSQELQINVQSINDPPRIIPEIPDSLFKTSQSQSVRINLDNFAYDVENNLDELYWSYDNSDDNLYSIKIESNPDILILNPHFNTSGTDIFTLFLWDTDGGFTTQDVFVNITPINLPPAIGDIPDLVLHYNENYHLDLSPYIKDPDTPMDRLVLTENSDYVGFNPSAPFVAILKYPETMMDTFQKVKFSLSDGQFYVYKEISIYVSDNNIPQKKNIPDLYFNEDTTLIYAIDLDDYFYDIDGDTLVYFFFGNENINIKINKDHSIDLSAEPNWYGSENIIFRAIDKNGALIEDSVQIIVKPVNDPPEITLGNLEIIEEIQMKVNLKPYLTDIDTPISELTISENSRYIDVTGLNLSFYYPSGIDFDIFTISVFDGEHYTNKTIHAVIHPNQPPEIDAIPDLILHYDYDYKFNLQPYISDKDNESDELILRTDSSNIRNDNLVPLSIILNFPKSFLGTTTTVTLDVSDGLLVSKGYFQVKISDDWAPELSRPLPNMVFDEDSINQKVLNLNDYFFDKDNDVLDFKVQTTNVFVTIQNNGYIDITARENWFGTEFITLTALDQQGAFAEDTIRIEFLPVNDPPFFSVIPPQSGKVNEIWSLDLKQYILDIDTNSENLVIKTNSDNIEISNFILFFNYPENITYEEVLITVSDGELSSEQILAVRIENSNIADEKSFINPSVISIIILFIMIIVIAVSLVVYRYRKKIKKPAGRYSADGGVFEPPDRYQPRFSQLGGSLAGELNTTEPDKNLTGKSEFDQKITSDISTLTKTVSNDTVPKQTSLPKLITLVKARSYLIEEPKPEQTFELFNSLVAKGLDGLCITRTHPEIVRKKYNVKDQPIIWLTSSKQVKNESYIPPPSLSRISLVVSNFLQKKHKGIIVLEGFEFLLNRDDFKTVLKLIHFLNDLVITNNSVLLVPIDPKILNEADLHMLERDFFLVHENDRVIISKSIEG